MNLWLAFRRLLVTFAVISVALAPATASAVPLDAAAFMATTATAADGMTATAMDDMPCCPPSTPVLPECQKGCPLAALCWAKLASGLPAAAAVPVRVAVPSPAVWRMNARFSSLSLRPPPEPPRLLSP